jgi:hypothetical protein
MPMDIEYLKKWRTSLIKEVALVGFLFGLLVFSLVAIYTSKASAADFVGVVFYDFTSTAALCLWAKLIKNDHELACYRGTVLCFTGLVATWIAILQITKLGYCLLYIMLFISAVLIFPATEERKT